MGKPLSKKIALVTGGSRGISAAIVRRLALEGAQVAFTYSASEKAAKALVKEISGAGAKAKAYRADAAAPKSLTGLIGKILSDFGALHILVNNAGTFLGGRIGEVKLADYERLMRMNVDSVFVLTNAAVKAMGAGARIINISASCSTCRAPCWPPRCSSWPRSRWRSASCCPRSTAAPSSSRR